MVGRLGSAWPFPAPDRLRASPRGVSCRAVVLMTVGAPRLWYSDCTADGKEQLLWFGLGDWHSFPHTTGQSSHSACLQIYRGGWNLLNGKRIKELVATQQHPSYTKCSISIRYYSICPCVVLLHIIYIFVIILIQFIKYICVLSDLHTECYIFICYIYI